MTVPSIVLALPSDFADSSPRGQRDRECPKGKGENAY